MATKPTTKQPVCLTCHGEVDWRFNDTTRAWQAFDAGTTKLHVCIEEAAKGLFEG